MQKVESGSSFRDGNATFLNIAGCNNVLVLKPMCACVAVSKTEIVANCTKDLPHSFSCSSNDLAAGFATPLRDLLQEKLLRVTRS